MQLIKRFRETRNGLQSRVSGRRSESFGILRRLLPPWKRVSRQVVRRADGASAIRGKSRVSSLLRPTQVRPYVIQRVKWTDVDVAVKASLTSQLRDALELAKASPADLPGGPAGPVQQLVDSDEVDMKKGDRSHRVRAAWKWTQLPSQAKAKLDEATWKQSTSDKIVATARAGQTIRVNNMTTQILSGTAP